MHTVELTVYVGDDWQELLIAELADLDFETFRQEDDCLRAYLPAPQWTEAKRDEIEQWLRNRGLFVPVDEEVIAPRNWNELWEEAIQPLAIGPFLVKPTWADVPPEHADKLLLEIDPKMSFGTGYHESTRLVLRFLPDLITGGERVLDAGTGTGILAIAACKLGAASAVAFDIDAWAQQNAVENFLLNGVRDRVTFHAGPLDAVPETGFDLILANINRNVLLGLLPDLAARLHEGGHLVLAGLLKTERARMLGAARTHDLHLAREADEGEWWSVVLAKAQA
ncbi:MAG: 50S ribosomal protein L11 methyltransferase [Bacteroidetes bacterium]|jgi:ribosomal protein L11 methyltransferase|nr:50S ribosomal protein L11 methyltransferase [Bacteroidota bacterium]